MSRRATLGPSSSSGQNIANGRMSMGGASIAGGKFAPVSKSNSRKSMVPSSASTVVAAPAASSSRKSIAPASARDSLGANRGAATDRRSGGRRSSVGAKSGARGTGVRSDPRPLGDKTFMREEIKKTVMYLASHHYHLAISPAQLAAPQNKDFKEMWIFLMKQVDGNFLKEAEGKVIDQKFEWDKCRLGLSFEETVKFWMKRFGYPFAISKNALQAAGSPHTWPALLAALVWLMESLTYYETIHGPQGLLGNETESRIYYEYVSGAYQSFLQGEDNFSAHDEALAQRFAQRNSAVSEEVRKLEVKISEHEQALVAYQSKEDRLAEMTEFRNACQSDIPKLEENIHNNQAYKASVIAKKEARQRELEVQNTLLANLQQELAEAQAILAKQSFTPLQVQEMMHQKSNLESSLDAQRVQQEMVQGEIWAKETEVSKKNGEVERVVAQFNEVSLALQESTAQASRGMAGIVPFTHEELRFNAAAESAPSMLNLDLKAHKESVVATKESLQHVRKELASELKRATPALLVLQETESERAAQVDALAKRSARVHDKYTSERAKMNAAGEEACAAVEEVELALVSLRNALAATGGSLMTDRALSQAAALEDQLTQQEAQQMSEEVALKQEVCTAMQILTEHKLAITARLEEVLAQAQAVRSSVEAIDVQ
jgi:kinetochore protein NDC80